MANEINWGLGAVNNSIEWGRGAVNNNISWGKAHDLALAKETDIVGLIYSLVVNFSARVTADLGTYEAQICNNSNLENFKIS